MSTQNNPSSLTAFLKPSKSTGLGLNCGNDIPNGFSNNALSLETGQLLEARVDGKKTVVVGPAVLIADDLVQCETFSHMVEKELVPLPAVA